MAELLIGALIVLTSLALAAGCLKQAFVDREKQALYRIRDSVYDRVMAGELSMKDDGVRGFVRFIHALIYTIDNWSLLRIAFIMASPKLEGTQPPVWRNDPRFTGEVHKSVDAWVNCARYASSIAGIAVLVIPLYSLVRGSIFERVVTRVDDQVSPKIEMPTADAR